MNDTTARRDAAWPPPPPSAERPGAKWRRTVPLWMLVSASGASLVLGSVLGSGAGASGTAEVQELLDTANADLAAVQQTSAAQEKATAAAQAARTAAEGGRSAAEARAASLQAEVDTMTADASSSATTIAARDARISELETAASSRAAAPVAVAAPAAAAPSGAAPAAAAPAAAAPATSASYANCDAVRAAGAAPITTGDPGYSRKLDRDGDGIGCEQ